KTNYGTILPTHTAASANHHGGQYITLFNAAARNRFLHCDLDDVTNACIAAVGATQDLDALHSTSATVISNVEHRFGLNHLLLSPTPALQAATATSVRPYWSVPPRSPASRLFAWTADGTLQW